MFDIILRAHSPPELQTFGNISGGRISLCSYGAQYNSDYYWIYKVSQSSTELSTFHYLTSLNAQTN